MMKEKRDRSDCKDDGASSFSVWVMRSPLDEGAIAQVVEIVVRAILSLGNAIA